jgi:hypothetical protein
MKRILIFGFLIITYSFHAQIKSSGLIVIDSNMSFQLDLDTQNSKVYLTLSGPSDRWFALGFNSSTMGTQTIDVDCVVMTSAANLTDCYIQHRSTPQADALNNWTLTDNTVSNSIRTIKANRDFVSTDNTDFNFTNALNALDIIFAYSYFQDNYALTGHGDGGNRGNVSVTFSNLESAQNHITSYDLVLFPNPVKEDLILVPNGVSFPEIEVTLYNFNHQIVFNKTFSISKSKEIKIPVTNLPEGIYFIKSKIDSFESFKKIIVKK